MKKILVPVDFSENSADALRYAVFLAGRMKAALLLMHVCASGHGADERTASGKLQAWAAKAKEENPGLEAEILLSTGETVKNITEAAAADHCELTVTGMHGSGGVGDNLFGSTSARLAEHLSCPLIMVPAGYRCNEVGKIVFATDYRSTDLDSIRFMVPLAEAFMSDLIIVHADEGEYRGGYERNMLNAFSAKVREAFPYPLLKFELLEGGNAAKILKEYLEYTKPALFALASRKRTPAEKIFTSSLTRRFDGQIKVPLLVFHAGAAAL